MRNFKNLSVMDWLDIFWRRKWYFMIVSFVVTAGTTLYAWRLPHVFRSETRIMVEAAPIPEDYARPVVRMSADERISAIRAQIQGRSFLSLIIEEFKLYGFGRLSDFVMDESIESLRNNIRITTFPGSIFSLSYASIDPKAAQEVTRGIAQRLVESNLLARMDKTERTDAFVDEQLQQTERELTLQEDKIRRFKTAHLGELPEMSSTNVNALSSLKMQMASAQSELDQAVERRKLLDFRLQEQKRIGILVNDLSLPTMRMEPEVRAVEPQSVVNPELAAKKARLAELTARLTPEHPDVKRLVDEIAEMEKQLNQGKPAAKQQADIAAATKKKTTDPAAKANPVPAAGVSIFDVQQAEIRLEIQAADNEISRRRRERDSLAGQIEAYEIKLSRAPALEQELAALNRDRDVLRQRRNDLEGKKFTTSMAAKLESDTYKDSYRVIDEANLPVKPEFPNKKHIALMGLAAGFLLGCGVVIGREYLDTTLRNAEEAAQLLHLPVLASIPELRLRDVPSRKALKAAQH